MCWPVTPTWPGSPLTLTLPISSTTKRTIPLAATPCAATTGHRSSSRTGHSRQGPCPPHPCMDSSVSLSLVFLPLNTRWSVLWLVRRSKVPVGGSFSGSPLDSPFSNSDSPLLGSVPSCCRCFTLSCLFSLALRYWLTLLLHTPTFHTLSTSRLNRHYVPLDEVCFCNSLLPVPIIVTFAPNKHHCHNASGPVVSHACSRRCHH